MPLYEYLCGSCGHRFERIQKYSDPPVRECPSCGGAVEKQFSSPAIQFKGSGFYITDYAKSGSKSEPNTESKSDSKPDSKTDSSSSTSKSSDTSSSTSSESKSEKSSSTESSAKPATPAATDKK